jgi:hypothetical protein
MGVGLPGADAVKAVVGELTYLGDEEVSTDRGRATRWIYYLDPTYATDEGRLCRPGASGTLITDGNSSLAVLTGISDKDTKDHEETVRAAVNRFNVELGAAAVLCYTVPLTRDTFNTYINGLN